MPESAAGSFTPLSSLRERAQSDRDERLAAEAAAKEEAKKKAEAEAAAKEPAKPKPIVHGSMIHGEMSADDLAAKYPGIVEQVKQKNYMLQGFATHDVKIGASTITLRTLRKSEQRVASLLAEGEIDASGMQVYHPDDLNRWSLMFALAKVGQQNFEPVATPTVGAAKRFVQDTNKRLMAFVESEDVKKRLAILDGWAAPVFQLVLAHFLDMTAAYQQAILQDMQNPS